jgi:hypothetical protein
MAIFRVGIDAPMGQAPEAESGDSHDVRVGCEGAIQGLTAAIAAIRADPDRSDAGKDKKIGALAAERTAQADKMAKVATREATACEVLTHEERKAASLLSPPGDLGAATRAAEIRQKYSTLSPSERNATINADDPDSEVLRALWFEPRLGNTLLSSRERAIVEDKILAAHDPVKHRAIASRAEDARRAARSLEVTRDFINRAAGTPLAGLRERIGAAPKSPGAPHIRERLAANKAD